MSLDILILFCSLPHISCLHQLLIRSSLVSTQDVAEPKQCKDDQNDQNSNDDVPELFIELSLYNISSYLVIYQI